MSILGNQYRQPGRCYAVTAYSCTCRGFAGHQRCKHLAALLSALGWLNEAPITPEPAPLVVDVPAPCRHCEGRGFWIKARRAGGG